MSFSFFFFFSLNAQLSPCLCRGFVLVVRQILAFCSQTPLFSKMGKSRAWSPYKGKCVIKNSGRKNVNRIFILGGAGSVQTPRPEPDKQSGRFAPKPRFRFLMCFPVHDLVWETGDLCVAHRVNSFPQLNFNLILFITAIDTAHEKECLKYESSLQKSNTVNAYPPTPRTRWGTFRDLGVSASSFPGPASSLPASPRPTPDVCGARSDNRNTAPHTICQNIYKL